MHRTHDKLIKITETAFNKAVKKGKPWADAVDEALQKAGYKTLNPVDYGAEQDTSLVAVVDIQGPVAIWSLREEQWVVGPIEKIS